MIAILNLLKKWLPAIIPKILELFTKPESLVEKMKIIYSENGGTWGKLNIFGIRNSDSPEKDQFNDTIVLFYKEKFYRYHATVDPSVYWTSAKNRKKAGFTSKGAAYLVFGFHKDIWKIGKHRSKYKALVQNKPVTVWRDKNEDFENDELIFDTGNFGINLHHAYDAKEIAIHGAGCQVIQNQADFKDFMEKVSESKKKTFSYLLINKKSAPLDLRIKKHDD